MFDVASLAIRRKKKNPRWLKDDEGWFVQHVLPYNGRIRTPRYYSPHPARDRYSFSPSGSDALSYGRTGRGEYSIVTGHLFWTNRGESGVAIPSMGNGKSTRPRTVRPSIVVTFDRRGLRLPVLVFHYHHHLFELPKYRT
jgi:hypothetical protein